ncbi:MAG: YceI family protein [Saprospirales bacterium]|nr:MAG: YceI family protein [Saprospirales bacterium]
MIKLLLLISTFALGLAQIEVSAQATFSLDDVHELKVEGTSTIHDWDMVSEFTTGSARITTDERRVEELHSLTFEMEVESLESGRRRMDRNAYSALESDSHPKITFEFKRVNGIEGRTISAIGDLTIAGETREIEMEVTYRVRGNGVRFSGSQEIAFSDFNIDAPTAMMGTVTTGDELTISFDVTYSRN